MPSDHVILDLRNALASVKNPLTGENIVASGMVHDLRVDDDGTARFTLSVELSQLAQANSLLAEAKATASSVEGIEAVQAVATAHRPSPQRKTTDLPPPQPPKPAPTRPATPNTAPPKFARKQGGHANPLGLEKGSAQKPTTESAPDNLAGVKSIIAVTSGKGGVGKSTVCVNLAVALAKAGFRVGLLDADIYGPSLPTLLGEHAKAEMKDGKIQPITKYGVRAMSMGWLVEPNQALAWRGPMVMGALRQLMNDVEWGSLDVLLVDTPPGTGDAHLSLIQSKKLSSAIIISTPQELALADVRRGAALFEKTQIPVLGVIENMAWLDVPGASDQHEKQYVFGKGGAQKAASELSLPFLGALPLFTDIQQNSDAGAPSALNDHSASGAFFATLANAIAKSARLSKD